MNHKTIISINDERESQDKQWGGPKHDDTHDPVHFLRYIQHQIDKVTKENMNSRSRLVKIAALAVAGIESMDRKRTALETKAGS